MESAPCGKSVCRLATVPRTQHPVRSQSETPHAGQDLTRVGNDRQVHRSCRQELVICSPGSGKNVCAAEKEVYIKAKWYYGNFFRRRHIHLVLRCNMRSFRSTIGVLATCAAAFAAAAPLESLLTRQTDSDKVGYLAVFWKTDETGVFFALSDNDNPLAFTEINGGEPIFVPTLGQKTVRDVSIVADVEDASKWHLVATDLNINDVSDFLRLASNRSADIRQYASWDAASANGSKAILIWDSTDLINWTDERLVTMENETAGMVWAPDAIWDPSANQYLVHWASKFVSRPRIPPFTSNV